MKRRTVRIVTIVIVLSIIGYSLFVVLPSRINVDDMQAALSGLTAGDITALVLAGLVVMVMLGWAAKASLPGLSLYQGFESSATSQMTAFLVPPPGDLVIRFAMYRTYDYSDEESATATLVAMIARYLAIFFMPLLGLAIVLATGNGSWSGLAWLLLLGAIFVLIVVVLLRVVRSEAVAHAVGGWLQRVAARVIRFFRRTPPTDLEDSVVAFGRRISSTVSGNGRSIIAANVSWGLANCLVFLLALRFSGLSADTVPLADVVFVTGAAMVLSSIPVPGGFAITAAGLLALIGLTTSEEEATFTAALVLYRIFILVLPMAVGTVFFLAWRWRTRRAADREVAESAEPRNG